MVSASASYLATDVVQAVRDAGSDDGLPIPKVVGGGHLIITGQLRSIKDGRSRRILPEWVEAYVQDRAKAAEDIW